MSSVGVIMCVYNKEKNENLIKALNSIYEQTYVPDQVILVIDGFIDLDKEEIIKKYNDLVIIRNKINYGLSYSLNCAMKISNTDYIMRMDSDDISDKTRVEKQKYYLDKYVNVDALGSWIYEIDDYDNIIKIVKYPKDNEACFQMFRQRNPVAHPAIMFRKTFFEKAGNYSIKNRVDQDSLLLLKGFKNKCIISNIQEPLLYFRRGKSFSKRRSKNEIKVIFRNRIRIIRELKFGVLGYIYLSILMLVYISPKFIKNILYNRLR